MMPLAKKRSIKAQECSLEQIQPLLTMERGKFCVTLLAIVSFRIGLGIIFLSVLILLVGSVEVERFLVTTIARASRPRAKS